MVLGRAVYDGQEDDIDHFMCKLNEEAKDLDSQIERMCNKYYQASPLRAVHCFMNCKR